MAGKSDDGDKWSGHGSPHPWSFWVLEDKVSHRGHFYPPRFSWVWRRAEDGLEVELEVEVDEEEGPVPISVLIRQPDGLTAEDYRQPVAFWVRRAAEHYAMASRATGEGTYRVSFVPPGEPVPMGRPASGRTDRAELERVAELYRRAEVEGVGVTAYIEEELGVTQRAAYRLIGKARHEEGLLPPAGPGRKARP